MDNEIKIEARKQYFKYFRIWFIVVGVLAVISLCTLIADLLRKDVVRTNDRAPVERVYDQADVLTIAEEDALRELIAKTEERIKADIVLVTSKKPMEGAGAANPAATWETNMMNEADDFYDRNGYGYDKACGDGLLILDNWYEGQAGSWLSTCGSMMEQFGSYEIDQVLGVIYYGIDYGAYSAYRDAIQEIGEIAGEEIVADNTYWTGAFFIATITAGIYILCKLRNKKGEKTVVAGTYVTGSPVTNVHRDDFIRKVVTRRHIPRQTGSSGGGSRSGGGGSHRSSGGVSHGGGGRRR